jgi:hypothetical protein
MDWRRSGLAGRKGTCVGDEVRLARRAPFSKSRAPSCPVISVDLIGQLNPTYIALSTLGAIPYLVSFLPLHQGLPQILSASGVNPSLF